MEIFFGRCQRLRLKEEFVVRLDTRKPRTLRGRRQDSSVSISNCLGDVWRGGQREMRFLKFSATAKYKNWSRRKVDSSFLLYYIARTHTRGTTRRQRAIKKSDKWHTYYWVHLVLVHYGVQGTLK